jgi:predicted AAA+ superfamily ATPase
LLREHERALFTDRSEILTARHRNAELIRQGEGVNLALVGQRRVGKTMLAQRFADDLYAREGRRYYIADQIIALWIKFTILERAPEYGGYKDAIRRYQDRLAEQAV